MAAASASVAVVAILSDFVEQHTGLHYGPQDRDLFFDKASDRAAEAGFDSLLDYYYYLRYDPAADAELSRLIDALVVNETYLFREFEQLRVIVKHCIEPLVLSGKRARIWSAACATGEEPVSLAMLLAEAGLSAHVDLVASDISERALTQARAGALGRRSLRSVPDPQLCAKWLVEGPGGTLTVSPRLRGLIEWRRVNLSEALEVAALGVFDVILCRNVLIYFSDETTAKVVSHLSEALVSGGTLFVGISESLLRFSTALECEERDRVFCYRKGT
jgi:chemotaxis protein methyltransferase CheR